MSKKTDSISGVVGYTVTPFDVNSGAIDVHALHESTEYLLNSGVNAIAALGCAGECTYLDDNEWKIVAEQSIRIVDKRVPIIIGISELTINKAVQKAVFAEDKGADVIMLAPLKHDAITDLEIYTYFSSVSDAITIPIMVYNNPAICGVDMSAEFILSMLQNIENICMIKDSAADINRIHKLQELSSPAFSIFTGCNYLALEALKSGLAGWCTAAPNLINNVPQKIFNAVKQNNLAEAERLFSKHKSLLKFIVEKGLARSVKAGLELKGISVGKPREPVRPLSNVDIEILGALLFDESRD
ncbi:MAG: dihydrodipicolinate synthase family protein [Methylophaga sp.]|nr:MAG: dihydrodipicolinate synthase family protein [Methylophaga sp.]